jgi:transcription elongation factor GreA
MEQTGVVYITKERLVELENILIELKTIQRKNIADKIAEARSHGDLSENAEYDAAKEAQAFNEMKIAELQMQLSRSRIINPAEMPNDEVHILSNVKVIDLKHKEEITFTLVSPDEADFELDKISITSPIGKALLGKKVGNTVVVDAPDGTMEYKILGISK